MMLHDGEAVKGRAGPGVRPTTHARAIRQLCSTSADKDRALHVAAAASPPPRADFGEERGRVARA